MPRVTFIQPNGTERTIDIDEGHSVMEGATKADMPGIDADCGGACACATCHVFVVGEWIERLTAPSEVELGMLECAINPGDGSRLSCQITMSSDLDGLRLRLPNSQR